MTPPNIFMVPFTMNYNPGSSSCASGWNVLGPNSLHPGQCAVSASLQNESTIIYGAIALAIAVALPGAWKALAILPAYAAAVSQGFGGVFAL